MKLLKYICICIAFSQLGCSDFLDKEPLTTLSPQSFWNTEKDLRLALNNLYKNLYDNGCRTWSLDNQSADCFAGVGDAISSGFYTPPNKDKTWDTSYKQIRVTNDFLENYEKAAVSEDIKNRYAGEARYFRAYFYYLLVTRFGDVPLIDKTLEMDSPELLLPREPKENIWKLIIEDLQFAEAHIPPKSALKNDIGRITKGTAQAFLARAAIYAGTHYKFHTGSNYQSYLQIARDAARRLIDSKEYSLYPNYRDLFLYPGEDSDEHIWSYRYAEESNTMNTRPRATINDFRHEPTKYLADAFLCKDGLPIGKSTHKTEYLPLGTEFANRDPRMALTIWKPGDSFMGQPFIPNLANQTRTGYMFKKGGDEDSYVVMASRIDEILIRYAEVLVTYAEACYELNDEISDEDLNISINTLRDRFKDSPDKLPHLTNSFVTQHGLNMRDEIRRERRVELCGECLRYDDIIRWKIAENELPREILGAKFDQEKYPSVVPGKDINVDTNGFILVQTKESRSFDVNKNYLLPLPLREISLNSNLIQNPNW